MMNMWWVLPLAATFFSFKAAMDKNPKFKVDLKDRNNPDVVFKEWLLFMTATIVSTASWLIWSILTL